MRFRSDCATVNLSPSQVGRSSVLWQFEEQIFMSGTELTDSVHVGLTSEDKPDLVEGLDSDYFVFKGLET